MINKPHHSNKIIKPKKRKDIFRSFGRLFLMLLLLLAAVAWRGQIFGLRIDGMPKDQPEYLLSAEDCHPFFKDADFVRALSGQRYNIFSAENDLLGRAFWYKGEQGYGGRVPLYIFTDKKGLIKGILPGRHYESSVYLENIEQSGFLMQWNGTGLSAAAAREVDVISGATITSHAIITGIRKAGEGQEINSGVKFVTIENVLSLLLLIILIFAYFQPGRFMKYRIILQIASVIIFGFWLGHFLSFAQIVNWISGGINWQAQVMISGILFFSVIFPLFYKKAFYCSWVCPYGAAQELCGKAGVRKRKIPSGLLRVMKYLREFIFVIILIILLGGFIFDLTFIEPFPAFSFNNVRYWVLGFAGFFLILSLFLPKAWCHYFCPTGYLLEWIRK